ncbi:hypothetical protein Plhal304r1_c031g0099661 [Plasmopara halstedii]
MSRIFENAIKTGTKKEERMLGFNENEHGISHGLLPMWENMKVGPWIGLPDHVETKTMGFIERVKNEGIPYLRDGKYNDGILLDRTALPLYVKICEQIGDDSDPYGVNALVENGHINDAQLVKLITSGLKHEIEGFDFILPTVQRLQSGLLGRCRLKKLNPVEVELLLMGEDKVLDDVHLEVFVRYFVLYNKAAIAGMIDTPSSQLLLNLDEVEAFLDLLNDPVLKKLKTPLVLQESKQDEAFEVGKRPALMDPAIRAVKIRKGIVKVVKSYWDENKHPLNVQQHLMELTKDEMDDFTIEVLGQYVLHYKITHFDLTFTVSDTAAYTSKSTSGRINLKRKWANKDSAKEYQYGNQIVPSLPNARSVTQEESGEYGRYGSFARFKSLKDAESTIDL